MPINLNNNERSYPVNYDQLKDTIATRAYLVYLNELMQHERRVLYAAAGPAAISINYVLALKEYALCFNDKPVTHHIEIYD